MSGSVSKGQNQNSHSLQMIERPLMSADELKSMKRGNFVVMKTGTNPMRTMLLIFMKWGIEFKIMKYKFFCSTELILIWTI